MADGQQVQAPDFNDYSKSQQSKPAPQAQAPKSAQPQVPNFNDYKQSKVPPAPVTQKQPGWLDTANSFYNNVGPNSSVISRVGKSLGRTAMMVPNLVNAVTAPPTDQEKQQGFTGAARIALPAHRLVVAPTENTEAQLSQQEQSDAAKGMPHSNAEIYGEHAVAALPVIGPWMVGEGQRAGSGDIAGAVTDVGTTLALPKVAKESMPGGAIATAADTITGGRIPGAPTPDLGINPPAFPTTTRIASNIANKGGLALERATSPAAIGGAAGAYAGHRIPAVGPGYGAAIGSGLASAISEHPLEPLIKVPGLRTLGSEDTITPTVAQGLATHGIDSAEAAENAGITGYKVAVPGKKAIPFEQWLKQQPTPKVQVVNPKAEAPVPQEEVNATANEALKDIQRKQGMEQYNAKYGPEGNPNAKVEPEPVKVEPVQQREAPKVSDEEVDKLANQEISKLQNKPELTDKQRGQFEHTIGKYASDKLADSVEGVEAAHRLRNGTYQNYADLANEEGIQKPQALRAKTGDKWTASDFSRRVSEHGKELNPSKEVVVRHLVDRYGADEIKGKTEDWGRK